MVHLRMTGHQIKFLEEYKGATFQIITKMYALMSLCDFADKNVARFIFPRYI